MLEKESMRKLSSFTVAVVRSCCKCSSQPGAASLSRLERKPENLQV